MNMNNSTQPIARRMFYVFIAIATVVALLGLITTQLLAAPAAPEGEGTTIFNFSGQLPAGASLPIPLNRANVTASNFELIVSDDGPVDFSVTNGGTLMSGQAQNGETFWGTGDLQPGVNTLNITNNGATTSTFTLVLRTLATTSYTWDGVANDGGQDSEIRLVFPQSGLYRFDFTTSGGAYLFNLDNGALQKQVEANTTAAYYVKAGTYPLQVQRTAGASVAWSVQVQPVAGSPFDTLPYAKEGANISTEILPISLAEAAEVNLVITPTGNIITDAINIEILSPDNDVLYTGSALVDEVFWGTLDLPAGNSQIRLTAGGGNVDAVDYSLVIDELPTADYLWQGNADVVGENSHIRVRFAEDGLYTFDYGLTSGRFQFVVNDEFIRKTVEDSAADVTYFIPAGTHDLYILQGQGGAEDWAVDIMLDTAGNDSLPYGQNGGLLGGIGNGFDEEWFPIALDEAATVNMSIETTGDMPDSLMVYVYEVGASSPSYTLTQALGTEKIWGNFDLGAGINRLHIVANGGNAGAMTYAVNLDIAPTDGTFSWDGNALDAGLNSAVLVEFPTTGTYRFQIDADPGFANLVLDDAMMTATNAVQTPLGNVQTTYDINVTAGAHELYVVQDPVFVETTWSASVEPVTAVAKFFTFDGILANGEMLTPEYTVPGGGDREFNYELTVSGGDVDLTITDGNSATIADVTAYDGETLWGTGTLSGNNAVMLSNTSGGDVTVTLNFYDLPTAGYDWDGNADGNGMAESSHIRVIFPENGLYDFAAVNDSGRYQFVVQAGGGGPEVIRKTVNANLSVEYFVPAGTHDLFIEQDRDGMGAGPGADWALAISDVGDANDVLPYTKNGGTFGQNGFDDFTEEWLTVNLAESSSVNLRSIASGALTNTDFVMVEVMDLNMSTILSTVVYSGETHWNTFDLPAGLHLIHIVGSGTIGGVSYDIELNALPTAPYDWSGIANGLEAQFSEARVTFPTDGLYTFTFADPPNARYQFLINDEFVQKTVEMADTLTVFIPAGTHTLQAVPDSAGVVTWDVSISAVGDANDSLPYVQMGGELGNGDFTEEWLPISVGEATQVNLEMSVAGNTADFLMVEVVNGLTGATTTTEIEKVYGTETFWATFDISPADRLHIMVDAANTGRLSYELEITPLPDAEYSWSGSSRGNGLNSEVRMDLDANGTYRVELQVTNGLAIFDIDPAPSLFSPTTGYTTAVTTSLTAGLHLFVVQQQAVAPDTDWTMTVSLLSAEAPAITDVTPDQKKASEVQTVNITGTDFQSGGTVELVSGADRYPLSIQTSSGTLLVVTVPDTIPVGTYDVVVTNPDTQVATAAGAYTVILDDAPTITDVSPAQKFVSETDTVTISGTGFQVGATVELTDGTNSYMLTVTDETSTTLTVTVPDTVAISVYDVVVTNPDTQAATAVSAYTVVADPVTVFMNYLPIITR